MQFSGGLAKTQVPVTLYSNVSILLHQPVLNFNPTDDSTAAFHITADLHPSLPRAAQHPWLKNASLRIEVPRVARDSVGPAGQTWLISGIPHASALNLSAHTFFGRVAGSSFLDKLYSIDSRDVRQLRVNATSHGNLSVGYTQEGDEVISGENIVVEADRFDRILGKYIRVRIQGRRVNGIEYGFQPDFSNTTSTTTVAKTTSRLKVVTTTTSRKGSTTTSRKGPTTSSPKGTTRLTRLTTKGTTSKSRARSSTIIQSKAHFKLVERAVRPPKNPVITKYVCDGQPFQLDCPSDRESYRAEPKVAQILRATYGRSNYDVCFDSVTYQVGMQIDTTYESAGMPERLLPCGEEDNVLPLLQTLCDCKQGQEWGCFLPPLKKFPFDPCKNEWNVPVYKYVKVSYRCAPLYECSGYDIPAAMPEAQTECQAAQSNLKKRINLYKPHRQLLARQAENNASLINSTEPIFVYKPSPLDPIGAFSMKYDFANVDIEFSGGMEPCPAGALRAIAQVDVPSIGKVNATGDAWFGCGRDNNGTVATSFAATLSTTSDIKLAQVLSLRNVSVQVSCVDHYEECFVPTEILNSTIYTKAVAGMLQGGNLTTWPELHSRDGYYTDLPPWGKDDILMATMLGSKSVLPVPSMICQIMNHTSTCEHPRVSVGAALDIDVIGGIEVKYALIVQNRTVSSQYITVKVAKYGWIGLNLTQSICDTVGNEAMLFVRNLPLGISSFEAKGALTFHCSNITLPSLPDLPNLPDFSSLSSWGNSSDSSSIFPDWNTSTWFQFDVKIPSVNFTDFGGLGNFSLTDLNLGINSLTSSFNFSKLFGDWHLSVWFGTDGSENATNSAIVEAKASGTTLETLFSSDGPIAKVFGDLGKSVNETGIGFVDKFEKLLARYDSKNGIYEFGLGWLTKLKEFSIDFDADIGYKNSSWFPSFGSNITLPSLGVGAWFYGKASNLPCSQNRSTELSGGLDAGAIPYLDRRIAGAVIASLTCSEENKISGLSFDGTVESSVNFTALGESIDLKMARVRFDTTTGLLGFGVKLNEVQLAIAIQNRSLSLLSIAHEPPVAIKDLPFVKSSDIANQVPWLANAMVSNVSITYAFFNESSVVVLQGNVTFRDYSFAAHVELSTAQAFVNKSWHLVNAHLALETPYGSLKIDGGDGCSHWNASVLVYPQGPLGVINAIGELWPECAENGSWTGYAFAIATKNVSVSLLNSTEFLDAEITYNVNYNKTDREWSVSGKNERGFTAKILSSPNSTSLLCQVAGQSTLETLPFGSNLKTIFPDELKDVDMKNISLAYTSEPKTINFGATIAVAKFGVQAETGVIVRLSNNGSQWTLMDKEFLFSVTIPTPVGSLNLNGDLACPHTSLGASLQLTTPFMTGSIVSGGFDWHCRDNDTAAWFNVTLRLENGTFEVAGQTLELKQVVLTYSNKTSAGPIVLKGQVVYNQFAAAVSMTYFNGTFTEVVLAVVGSSKVIGSDAPMTGLISDGLMASNTSLISPSAIIGDLVVKWSRCNESQSQCVHLSGGLVDGDVRGQVKIELIKDESWRFVNGSLYVAVEPYGYALMEGSRPCGQDGGLKVTANLTLPVLEQQFLKGDVSFKCENNTIQSWNLRVQDNFTVHFEQAKIAFEASLFIESGQSVKLRAGSIEDDYEFALTIGLNKTYHEFSITVQDPAPFNRLPFSKTLGMIFDPATPSNMSTPISDAKLLYAQVKYTNDDGNATIVLEADVEDKFNDWGTGAVNVTIIMAKNESWTLEFVDINAIVKLADYATLKLDIKPICKNGVVRAEGGIAMQNLPVGIPSFSQDNVLVEFACPSVQSINWTDYKFAIPLPSLSSLSLDILGGLHFPDVGMPNLSYKSTTRDFKLDFLPNFQDVKMLFSVSFGESKTTVSALPNKIDLDGIFKFLKSIIPGFDGSTSVSGVLGSIGDSIVKALTGVSLDGVKIEFKSDHIWMNGKLNLWGLLVDFVTLAPSTGGSAWGVILPNTKDIKSGIAAVDSFLQSIDIEGLFIGSVHQKGIISLPNGQQVHAQDDGFIMSGMLKIGNIGKYVDAGQGLTSTLKHSDAIGISISVGSGISLAIDLNSKVEKSEENSYSGITLILAIHEHDMMQKIEVQVAFTYHRLDTTTQQTLDFYGAIGLELDEVHTTVFGEFRFQGDWHNPFGISKKLDVYVIALRLGLDLKEMLPTELGMELNATIQGYKAEPPMGFWGQFYVDMNAPQDSALAFSLNNAKMTTLVGAFSDNLPDWAVTVLEKFTVKQFDLSFTKNAGNQVWGSKAIPPGLYLKIRDLQFGEFSLKSATFAMTGDTLHAEFNADPMNFWVFQLTGKDNAYIGPSGNLTLSPTWLRWVSKVKLHCWA